jgi:PTH1 family peptidyl-tRNA hydrolase
MKLIIGLGNPDPEYAETRHNVGFMIVDKIAAETNAGFEFDKKIDAEMAKGKFDDKPVMLAKPHTYVNKSGEAVKKLKNKLKIKPVDIVVVHDDLDIEFGKFKVSFEKNSGGHKGVQNIIDNLKTNKFWRLRIGTANKKVDTARDQNLKEKKELIKDFVLAKFSPTERDELTKIIKKALEGLGNSIR